MMHRITGFYNYSYKDKLTGMVNHIIQYFLPKNTFMVSHEYKNYLEHEYPRNHTFRIVNNKLKPKYRLANRYKKIRALYPSEVTSLVDISCSKGYFVFAANEFPTCTRSLGIDVNQYALNVCKWLKVNLVAPRVSFEKKQLHELAAQLEEFGGPFQTLLLVNAYQYLYFGSDNFRECYLDHDVIFRNLRKICSGRIIFNNRLELLDCQNIECIEFTDVRAQNYSTEKMLAAASKYFKITQYGTIGKYPLFAMDAK